MDKIRLVMSKLDVREVCLSITNDYYPDKTKVDIIPLDMEGLEDIIITIENENYIDKIYGRKIKDKYYFARHQCISKKANIDYYDEFFSTGEVLKIIF